MRATLRTPRTISTRSRLDPARARRVVLLLPSHLGVLCTAESCFHRLDEVRTPARFANSQVRLLLAPQGLQVPAPALVPRIFQTWDDRPVAAGSESCSARTIVRTHAYRVADRLNVPRTVRYLAIQIRERRRAAVVLRARWHRPFPPCLGTYPVQVRQAAHDPPRCSESDPGLHLTPDVGRRTP
jgi:hypothetical protein